MFDGRHEHSLRHILKVFRKTPDFVLITRSKTHKHLQTNHLKHLGILSTILLFYYKLIFFFSVPFQ